MSLPCAKEYRPSGDIVYTRDTHDENYLSTQEGKHLPVAHCLRGTPGWEILPEILAAGAGKTAAILDKPTFASTALVDFAAAGGL